MALEGANTKVPVLNKGMIAGKDRMDDNDHQDVTGRSHGTNQGLMRVNGRDLETSQASLETRKGKTHGKLMEGITQGIYEQIDKDFNLTSSN